LLLYLQRYSQWQEFQMEQQPQVLTMVVDMRLV
jgi:hypothetical protein